ncbi:MAG: amidase [Dehalococcoidia bacterium]|nr:amidase [Dehalococcoidia bacterium]
MLPSPAMTDGLWRLDATAQAALVRRGDVSPPELAEAAIERIDRLNPRLNAVITSLYELGRAQAAQPAAGPFRGVPLLLKDAGVEVAGTPMYLGTRMLRDLDYRSPSTDEMGRRLTEAGFTFLGKTNIPPLSAGATTEPPAFGPSRNPWALDRTVGGSSGGSAAAVAAGLVSMAHGADATGSLRFPASACGVLTLNPTGAAVPCTTPADQPNEGHVWRAFVLARSVRDLARALDALADVEALDPAPGVLPRLRIGLMADLPGTPAPAEPDCRQAVEVAGEAIEGLGHRVEEAHPPLPDFLRALRAAFPHIVGPARLAQRRWLEDVAGRAVTDDDVEPGFLAAAALGERVTAEQTRAANEAVQHALAPVLAWWDRVDVLVTPVMRRVPWLLGEDAGAAHVGGFVQFSSFSRQPSMSLPLHWTAEGLPVGVQLVGARRRDRTLLALAGELEQACPWAHRWPAIAPEG